MEIKRSFIKTITITILVLIGLALVTAIYFYNKIYSDNTLLKNKQLFYLYISSNAKLSDVTDSLSKHEILKDL